MPVARKWYFFVTARPFEQGGPGCPGLYIVQLPDNSPASLLHDGKTRIRREQHIAAPAHFLAGNMRHCIGYKRVYFSMKSC